MRTATLGRTGLAVSALGIGTMTFGHQCDEAASRSILDRAVDAGINLVDTADVYPVGAGLGLLGRSEEIVGRWLRRRHRDDIVVATKVGTPVTAGSQGGGGRREHIQASVEASLRRLQVDHIDLYQLHVVDPCTPIEETLEELDRQVRRGVVRHIGWSNVAAYRLALALGRSDMAGLVRFATLQTRYNLLFRQAELQHFDLCAEEGLGLLVYNPLAGGLLAGVHTDLDQPVSGRFALDDVGARYRGRYWHGPAFRTVERLRALAEDAGLPLATLALAWVATRPVITTTLVGVSGPHQLDDLLAAAAVTLPDDVGSAMDRATRLYRLSDAPF